VALNSITLILKPIKNLKKIRPCHMTLEIQVLVWDRHTYVAGLNWLMRSLPSSL